MGNIEQMGRLSDPSINHSVPVSEDVFMAWLDGQGAFMDDILDAPTLASGEWKPGKSVHYLATRVDENGSFETISTTIRNPGRVQRLFYKLFAREVMLRADISQYPSPPVRKKATYLAFEALESPEELEIV